MANSYGPYTPIVQAGDYYFISGQVGIDDAKHADPDVQKQTHQALLNLSTILESANLQPSDIIKTTVFLKNMDYFPVVNEIYMAYFPEPKPARSCIAVADLPHVADAELLVEIEAVAYMRSSE